MRLGIDAHILGKNAGGVERFVSHLVSHLPAELPDWEIVAYVGKHYAPGVSSTPVPNLSFRTLASANPLIERSLLLPALCRADRLDVLVVQRLAPWFCGRTRLVTVVHDITPIKYPQAYRGLTNRLVRLLTADSVRRSALVLTPTRSVADEVATRYGESRDKFLPFYNGIDGRCFRPASAPQKEDYLLIAGALEARKNMETVFRARARLGNALPWEIRIVGGVRDPAYKQSLCDLATELGIADQVHWLGFVDDEALVHLYQRARLYLTASRDEGFNIPPLEALACGTPVCCSDIPVHRELFDGAAFFFDTESDESLAAALLRAAQGGQDAAMTEAARRCVERFTWPAMARKVGARLAEQFGP